MRQSLSFAAIVSLSLCIPGRAQEAAAQAGTSPEALETMIRGAVAASAAPSGVLSDFDPRTAGALALKTARKLRSARADVVLEKTPVGDALRLLTAIADVPLTFTAKAQAAIAEKKTEITAAISGLPLENALNLLGELAPDFRFAVRYGALVCMLKEEYKPRTVLVVYNVSDIVRPRPDFPAPRLGLGVKDGEK